MITVAVAAILVISQASSWKKPYEVLPLPEDTVSLETKLNGGREAIWLVGDVLTIVRKQKSNGVTVIGGIFEPMTRVGESDLWSLRLKMADWEKAFISLRFSGIGPSVLVDSTELVFRGPQAPRSPYRVDALEGELRQRTFRSKALGEDRRLTIYIPPNAPKDLPVVFLADGQTCQRYAELLDGFIRVKAMRPVAIVGVHNAGYRGNPQLPYDKKNDWRMREYVVGTDPDLFEKHMRFFAEEVPGYVAKEFGISTKREDHWVCGPSSAGAFAAAAGALRGDVFAGVIPLSPATTLAQVTPKQPLAKFRIAAGTLEGFIVSATELEKRVKEWGGDVTMSTYVSGHDQLTWEQAFVDIMRKEFGQEPPKDK